MNTLQALDNLDPDNDAHWTANGLPRLDVLRVLTTNEALTRQEVTDVNPAFTRDTMKAAEAPEPEGETMAGAAEAKFNAENEGGTFPDADKPEVMVEAEDPEDETKYTVDPDAEPLTNERKLEIIDEALFTDPVADEGYGGVCGSVLEDGPGPAPKPRTKLEALQAFAKKREKDLELAQRENDAAKINADLLANEVTAINAEISRLTPWDRHGQTAGIKPYIASQNRIRLEKADRMNKFIQATGGATPGELRKALDARSALDVAMAGRKPARNMQRSPVKVPTAGL